MSNDYIKSYMQTPTPFANETNFSRFVNKNVIVYGTVSTIKNQTLYLQTGASGIFIL